MLLLLPTACLALGMPKGMVKMASARMVASPALPVSVPAKLAKQVVRLPSTAPAEAATMMPGIAATGCLALAANDLAARTSLSPLLWAVLLGMGLGNAWPKAWPKAGVAFAKMRLLRAGIILYVPVSRVAQTPDESCPSTLLALSSPPLECPRVDRG